jgi:hypothetical protein
VELGVYLSAEGGPALSRLLAVASFGIAVVFIYRSFYRMRIES